jgi:hypothetical protein
MPAFPFSMTELWYNYNPNFLMCKIISNATYYICKLVDSTLKSFSRGNGKLSMQHYLKSSMGFLQVGCCLWHLCRAGCKV